MWSYKTLLGLADKQLVDEMNDLGARGWKLLHAFPMGELAGGYMVFCIFGKYHDPTLD